MDEQEKKEKDNECKHENLEYLYTYDDWYDGDSDDIYQCLKCKKRIREYIGR